MKKPPLAAFALVLATVLAVVYFLIETGSEQRVDDARKANVTAPVSAPERAPEIAAPTTGEAAPTETTTNAPGDAAVAEHSARESVASTTRVSLAGSVTFPASTPADEQVEVLVFDVSYNAGREALDATDEALKDNKHLIARATVDAAGAFELELPAERAVDAWIGVRARYLYLDPGVRLAHDSATLPALTPYLGAWISGRCVAPSDATDEERALAKTKLELYFDPLKAASSGAVGGGASRIRAHNTSVGEDGSYELRGVSAGDIPYRVRAVPSELAAARSDEFTLAPGQHFVVDLHLERGGSVTGRVIDAAGKPVADVKVAASIDPVMWGRGGWELREQQSAADGTFALRALLPGKLDLFFEKTGHLELKRSATVASAARVDLGDVVLDAGATISGKVTWSDGAPASNVEVKASFDPAALGGMSAFNAFQGAEGEARSDAEGRFVVNGLGKGPFSVAAKARPRDADENDKSVKHWHALAEHVKPDTKDLALVLNPPLSVAGRVVDAEGKAVPTFTVSAQENRGGMFAGLGARMESQEFNDPDGRFALEGVSTGTWDVTAIAAGFTRSATASATLPRAADAAPLELVLQRGGSVSGMVLATDGTPFAGAEVQLKLSLGEMMKRNGEGFGSRPRATSDAEGRFELTNLTPGRLSFAAQATGFAQSEAVSVELASEQQVTGLELRLRIGGMLTGEVFGSEGGPLSGGTILVQQSAAPEVQRFTTTDAKGTFRVEHLEPGDWNVISMPLNKSSDAESSENGGGTDALAMFSDMKMATAKIVEGEEAHVVLGAPPKDPVQVHGRVHAADKGVPGAVITFLADGKKGMDGLKFTTSDSNGEYKVKVNEPGRFMVSVQKVGNGAEQQTVAHTLVVPDSADFEHDIVMPLGSIAGRVLDPEGQPAANVRVSLSEDGAVPNGTLVGAHFAEISTGADGRYELSWLKPGRYSVSVGGAPFGGMFGGEATGGRQIRSGIVVAQDGRVDDVDFKLKRPGRITGTVRDGGGHAVRDAAIFLHDGSGRALERFSMVVSDSAGQFTYEGLEPGEYTVIARTSSETSSDGVVVSVREGAASDVALSLSPGTVLIVMLQDGDGNPVDCSFEVLDERGHQVNGTMSLAEIMRVMTAGDFSSKEQRVGPLPPGKYRVTATTSDGRSVNKPVTLTGQPERRLNIRL